VVVEHAIHVGVHQVKGTLSIVDVVGQLEELRQDELGDLGDAILALLLEHIPVLLGGVALLAGADAVVGRLEQFTNAGVDAPRETGMM
jgi:hypothetical protein